MPRRIKQPLFPHQITEEHKTEFVNLLYEGHKRNIAANHIGTTSTRLKRLCNPRSQHYDPAFAQAWADAENSDEHQRNAQEDLRAMIAERSQTSDNLLIKRAINELPEWEHWRHRNLQIDMNVKLKQLLVELPHLTDAELEARIQGHLATRDQPSLRALPPGDPQ